MKKRTYLAAGIVCLLIVATVLAATTVTVTKTSSRSASAYSFDGTYYVGASLSETDTGYYLNYYVYDYSTRTYIERGYGLISSSDASITANSAWVDVDTSGIAIIGDGGTLDIAWTANGINSSSSDRKITTTTDAYKQISFSGYTQTSCTAEGTFLDVEDWTATGFITTNDGKVILQVK